MGRGWCLEDGDLHLTGNTRIGNSGLGGYLIPAFCYEHSKLERIPVCTGRWETENPEMGSGFHMMDAIDTVFFDLSLMLAWFCIASLHIFVENTGTCIPVFVHSSRSGVWLGEVDGVEAVCMVHTTIIYTGLLPPRCGVIAQGCASHALFQQETGTHSTWLGKPRTEEINRQRLTVTHSVLAA